MELKKTFRDLVKWGSENEKHRKEVVENAAFLIAVLTQYQGKKISDKDLEQISGAIGPYLGLSHWK